MPYQAGSSKILLFFHGNAEDIGLAMDLLVFIRDMLQVHVIAMEYPGYGIYQHSDSNA
jgi:abhydrolase domain-containing protein 17